MYAHRIEPVCGKVFTGLCPKDQDKFATALGEKKKLLFQDSITQALFMR